jgi:hypothetical protein
LVRSAASSVRSCARGRRGELFLQRPGVLGLLGPFDLRGQRVEHVPGRIHRRQVEPIARILDGVEQRVRVVDS